MLTMLTQEKSCYPVINDPEFKKQVLLLVAVDKFGSGKTFGKTNVHPYQEVCLVVTTLFFLIGVLICYAGSYY